MRSQQYHQYCTPCYYGGKVNIDRSGVWRLIGKLGCCYLAHTHFKRANVYKWSHAGEYHDFRTTGKKGTLESNPPHPKKNTQCGAEGWDARVRGGVLLLRTCSNLLPHVNTAPHQHHVSTMPATCSPMSARHHISTMLAPCQQHAPPCQHHIGTTSATC